MHRATLVAKPVAGSVTVSGPRGSYVQYDKDLNVIDEQGPWIGPEKWDAAKAREELLYRGYPQRYIFGLPVEEANTKVFPPSAGKHDEVGASTQVLDYTSEYMRASYDMESLWTDFEWQIQQAGVQFDTLVGTGLSGSVVAPELARRMRCEWAIVRKHNDGSHSGERIEGKLGRRWLFLDDLVGIGRTFARVWDVVEAIRITRNFDTQFVGGYLYYHHSFYAPQSGDIPWERYIKQFSEHNHIEREIAW